MRHRRMRLAAIAAASIVLSASGFVRAADLVEVYHLAVENDAHLQAANFDYLASSEAIIQARAGLLPEIALEAETIESKQKILSSDNSVFAEGSTSFPTDTYNLSVNVPIFHYDSWKRFSQSKSVVKQSKAKLLAAEQALIFDTAEHYFKVLGARDNLAFAQAEKTAVGRQLELAQARLSRGLATVTNLRDAQARFSNSLSLEIEAENDLADSYQAMQEYTGTLISDFSSLRSSIPLNSPDPIDLATWIELATAQNFDLEARRQAIEVARDEAALQRAGHYPTLDLVGVLNNRDTNGSLFGGGSEVQTTDYLLRLRLPLYQGGATSSMTREAGFRHQQARREFEAERRTLERETRAAYQGVLSGIKKVEALKQSVEFQQSTLEVKEEGLKAGINTMLAVLDAQRDLYYSRRDYAQARYDYLLSVLRLKKASGTLSADDLSAMNGLLAAK